MYFNSILFFTAMNNLFSSQIKKKFLSNLKNTHVTADWEYLLEHIKVKYNTILGNRIPAAIHQRNTNESHTFFYYNIVKFVDSYVLMSQWHYIGRWLFLLYLQWKNAPYLCRKWGTKSLTLTNSKSVGMLHVLYKIGSLSSGTSSEQQNFHLSERHPPFGALHEWHVG